MRSSEPVEHEELALARVDLEAVVARQPGDLVGEQAGAVDRDAAARRRRPRGRRRSGAARSPAPPRPHLGAAGLRGGGQRARVGDRVGHRLARDVERAVGCSCDLDAVGRGVGGERGHLRALGVVARAQRRAAADDRDAERLEHRVAQLRPSAGSARVSSSPGVESKPGVQDPRVRAAGPAGELVLGLEQHRVGAAAGERERDRASRRRRPRSPRRRARLSCAVARVLAGLLDERGDHARLAVGLGVPLDAEREAALGVLERLGQLVVGRPAADREAVADRRRRPGGGARACRAAPRRRRARRASRRRGARGGRCPRTCRGVRRWSWWPRCSGRSCTSVPPRATFITCMPRQMPRNGMSRSIARVASASSKWSRSGRLSSVSGCGVLAVGDGVDVAPAGQDQAVEQVEHAVGLGGEQRVGREHERRCRPAAWTASG